VFTHILDPAGRTVFKKNLPAGPEKSLDAVKPYRHGLGRMRTLP
jgi:hypothetical protein